MSYIFNRNHNRTHEPGCRAIGQMNYDKNAVSVDEPRGHGCKLCGTPAGLINYTPRDQDSGLDPYIGERICHDPHIREVLKKNGCSCGSHNGDIRMHPHDEGVQVLGEDGTWWIYFHCYKCGHDTSLSKVSLKVVQELAKEGI